MKLFAAIILVFLTACQSKPPAVEANPTAIKYIIEPTTFENAPALKVTINFPASHSGKTTLVLPERWASEKDYYKDIRALVVKTPGATITENDQPFLRNIHSSLAEQLVVTYTVVPGKNERMNPYRALVTPEYFHVVGYNLFAFPDVIKNQDRPVTIEWRGFPKNFAFANSFNANTPNQSLTVSIDHLQEAIYVGGDFVVHKEVIHDAPVYIAIRGKWQFSKKQLFAKLRKIIETQRGFFNDHAFPHFLVTIIPNGKPCCTNGGTGLYNSFATFLPADQKIDSSLIWLYAHELFHTWNGSKIPQPTSGGPLCYWFSEGFTSYYARRLSLKAGLISLPEYIEDYNLILYNYGISPVKNDPNTRIEKDFWNSPEVERLPYYRGDILAHNWNSLLKKATPPVTIDSPMRDMFQMAQQKSATTSQESWNKAMSSYVKEGIKQDLARYIEKGETIPAEPDALGPCVTMNTVEVGVFEYGFDGDATRTNQRMTGVIEDSEAYRAGLREGQKVLERKIVYPPFKKSLMKVSDAKGVHRIEFFAAAKETRMVPQYVLDVAKFKKDPKGCVNF